MQGTKINSAHSIHSLVKIKFFSLPCKTLASLFMATMHLKKFVIDLYIFV